MRQTEKSSRKDVPSLCSFPWNVISALFGSPSESENDATDFNEEGRKQLKSKLTNTRTKRYEPSDDYRVANVIYQDPNTSGKIYVGDVHIASKLKLLESLKISRIVNCTRPTSNGKGELPNFFEGKPSLTYYGFPIAEWFQHTQDSTLAGFFMTMFDFVERALVKGENVLVHCLAGAHRAGSAGIALVMHFEGLPFEEAFHVARKRRSIIEPIAHLRDGLVKLDEELKALRAAKCAAASPLPVISSDLPPVLDEGNGLHKGGGRGVAADEGETCTSDPLDVTISSTGSSYTNSYSPGSEPDACTWREGVNESNRLGQGISSPLTYADGNEPNFLHLTAESLANQGKQGNGFGVSLSAKSFANMTISDVATDPEGGFNGRAASMESLTVIHDVGSGSSPVGDVGAEGSSSGDKASPPLMVKPGAHKGGKNKFMATHTSSSSQPAPSEFSFFGMA